MARGLEAMMIITGAGVPIVLMITAVLFRLQGRSDAAADNGSTSYRTDVDGGDNMVYWRCNLATYDPVNEPKFDGCVQGFNQLLKDDRGIAYPPDHLIERDFCDLNANDLVFCLYCQPGCLQSGRECCVRCANQLGSLMDQYCVHSYGAFIQTANCELRYETYGWRR